MRIDIITIFPSMFESYLDEGLLKKAQEENLVTINLHNLRDYAPPPHHQVDDTPYGGGVGMVMKPEFFFDAVLNVLDCSLDEVGRVARVVVFTPKGELLTQKKVEEFSGSSRLVLLCGRYEGIDERVCNRLATDEVSLGDYVLAGGELAALVLTEAVSRLVPGVVGKEESVQQESFSDGLLEYPQYTRPRQYRDLKVPDVLLSGNHKDIEAWRRRKSLEETYRRRCDLLKKARLTFQDKKLLEEIKKHLGDEESG